MITGELKSKVDRIWDTMWSGGISNPLSVIEQFTDLLFIKRLDELHTLRARSRSSTNGSQRHVRRRPITHRVRSVDPSRVHYILSDFAHIPRWDMAPRWKQRLVMFTEQKVRPLREALHEHKKAQRMFLHSPAAPDINLSFDDFVL